MVVRISDKTQNYSKVTKLLVKPSFILKIVFFDTDLNLFLFNDSLSKVKYYSFFESDSYKDIPILKPI